MPRFQPEAIFRELDRHGVRYVLIGGLAATLHGSPLRTGDADICPARDSLNLERLTRVLAALDARIRSADAPDGLPFACDARFLGGIDILNLTTRFGDLDLVLSPPGTEGYDDLRRAAVTYDLGGLSVVVAALEDLIRSKEATGRPKDAAVLPTLRGLLERRDRRDDTP